MAIRTPTTPSSTWDPAFAYWITRWKCARWATTACCSTTLVSATSDLNWVNGNQDTYDTFINLGSGVRLLDYSVEMRSLGHNGLLFDNLSFSNFRSELGEWQSGHLRHLHQPGIRRSLIGLLGGNALAGPQRPAVRQP